MKFFAALILSLSFWATSYADSAAPLRLDASAPDKIQSSFLNMLASLDPRTQQEFSAAMATIGVYYMQDAKRGGNIAMKNAINGKTADEIITLSRKLFPDINRNRKIIDGTTADAFGKSVAEILISLPPEKQTAFSEAIATLMYKNQKDGKKEIEIMKQLDGKTAAEVVALATGVEAPFDNPMVRTPKDYTLRQMTDQEAAKYRAQDPEPNLSPNSLVE